MDATVKYAAAVVGTLDGLGLDPAQVLRLYLSGAPLSPSGLSEQEVAEAVDALVEEPLGLTGGGLPPTWLQLLIVVLGLQGVAAACVDTQSKNFFMTRDACLQTLPWPERKAYMKDRAKDLRPAASLTPTQTCIDYLQLHTTCEATPTTTHTSPTSSTTPSTTHTSPTSSPTSSKTPLPTSSKTPSPTPEPRWDGEKLADVKALFEEHKTTMYLFKEEAEIVSLMTGGRLSPAQASTIFFAAMKLGIHVDVDTLKRYGLQIAQAWKMYGLAGVITVIVLIPSLVLHADKVTWTAVHAAWTAGSMLLTSGLASLKWLGTKVVERAGGADAVAVNAATPTAAPTPTTRGGRGRSPSASARRRKGSISVTRPKGGALHFTLNRGSTPVIRVEASAPTNLGGGADCSDGAVKVLMSCVSVLVYAMARGYGSEFDFDTFLYMVERDLWGTAQRGEEAAASVRSTCEWFWRSARMYVNSEGWLDSKKWLLAAKDNLLAPGILGSQGAVWMSEMVAAKKKREAGKMRRDEAEAARRLTADEAAARRAARTAAAGGRESRADAAAAAAAIEADAKAVEKAEKADKADEASEAELERLMPVIYKTIATRRDQAVVVVSAISYIAGQLKGMVGTALGTAYDWYYSLVSSLCSLMSSGGSASATLLKAMMELAHAAAAAPPRAASPPRTTKRHAPTFKGTPVDAATWAKTHAIVERVKAAQAAAARSV